MKIPDMTSTTLTPIERLTSSELSGYLTAVRLLVHGGRDHGILEPVLMTKLVSLAVDLEAQQDERAGIVRAARTAAQKASA